MLTTVDLLLKLFHFYQLISQIFIEHNAAIIVSIWEQINSWLHPVLCDMDKLLIISWPQFSFPFFQIVITTRAIPPLYKYGERKTRCFYNYYI